MEKRWRSSWRPIPRRRAGLRPLVQQAWARARAGKTAIAVTKSAEAGIAAPHGVVPAIFQAYFLLRIGRIDEAERAIAGRGSLAHESDGGDAEGAGRHSPAAGRPTGCGACSTGRSRTTSRCWVVLALVERRLHQEAVGTDSGAIPRRGKGLETKKRQHPTVNSQQSTFKIEHRTSNIERRTPNGRGKTLDRGDGTSHEEYGGAQGPARVHRARAGKERRGQRPAAKGQQLLEAGDAKGALPLLARAVGPDPDNAGDRSIYAAALFESGEFTRGEEEFVRAKFVEPRSFGRYWRTARRLLLWLWMVAAWRRRFRLVRGRAGARGRGRGEGGVSRGAREGRGRMAGFLRGRPRVAAGEAGAAGPSGGLGKLPRCGGVLSRSANAWRLGRHEMCLPASWTRCPPAAT